MFSNSLSIHYIISTPFSAWFPFLIPSEAAIAFVFMQPWVSTTLPLFCDEGFFLILLLPGMLYSLLYSTTELDYFKELILPLGFTWLF